MIDKPIIVTMRHVRQAQMCSKGVRNYFIKHNLDWNRFISDGLPIEIVEAINDVMALQVAKVARGKT